MPPTGSQPSFTANSTISMMPSQKLGAAKKNMAATETRLSQKVRTFIEATTPAATPTARASVMLETISSRVAGRWIRDGLDDRHVLAIGEAEIEMQQRPDVFQELQPHRVVEAVGLAQQLDGGGVAHLVLGRHQLEEAAGRELDQAEVDHHHAQDQRHGLDQPPPQEFQRRELA